MSQDHQKNDLASKSINVSQLFFETPSSYFKFKAKRLDECGRSDQKLELRVLLCCVTESQSGLRLSHTARSDSQFKLLVGSATFIQHAHFSLDHT